MTWFLKKYRAVDKDSPGRPRNKKDIDADACCNSKSKSLLDREEDGNDAGVQLAVDKKEVVSSKMTTSNSSPSSSSGGDGTSPKIVFESPASYHRWTYVLLSIAPMATLISMVIVHHEDRNKHKNYNHASQQKKEDTLFCLFWITVALILVFVAVLPRLYRVYSDASIVVKSLLFTWRFDNVIGAVKDPPFDDDVWHPRLKFSTNFNKRVLVMRRDVGGCCGGCGWTGFGGWDVLVSPSDTKGFIAAVIDCAADAASQEESGIGSV